MRLDQKLGPPQTPPNSELNRIAEKLADLLSRVTATSIAGLQYRMCEVGNPSYRLDPKLLKRALAELENNRRPRRGRVTSGPWQAMRGIFVSPEVLWEEARQRADQENTRIHYLTTLINRRDLDLLVDEILSQIDPKGVSQRITRSSSLPPHERGHLELREYRVTVTVGPARRQACAWVTNDIPWLFPEDHRLWQHLLYCHENQLQALIITRKISTATFPILKRLNAFGLQLHNVYAAADDSAEIDRLVQNMMWPKTVSLTNVRAHSGLEHLTRAFSEAPQFAHKDLPDEAIAHASELRLDSDQPNKLQRLLKWAVDMDPAMPAKWHATLNRWQEWNSYRPPARRILSSR